MNQNGEHLMNLCELSILEMNTKSYSLCVLHMIVKARTFESTNHKIKLLANHRVMEDACIREGISLEYLLSLSHSVSLLVSVLSSFKCSQ